MRHPLLLSFLLASCAVASPSESEPPASCEEATSRIEACLGAAEQGQRAAGDCEAMVEDAAFLCTAEKADFWGQSLCGVGVLHYCDVPVCQVSPRLSGDSCSELIDAEGCGACDYYLCREAADEGNACGDTGYYLGYGHKYCERMTQVTRPRMSTAGQAWLDDVRHCLMEEIEDQVVEEDSCQDIKSVAFRSHPDCYVDAGFCSLTIRDWWLVLSTVDPSDLAFRQVLLTGVSCLGAAFY